MDNSLLNLLPAQDKESFLASCDLVRLDQHALLIEVDEPIDYSYFPISGLVSLLVVMNDGSTVQAAMIGSEGYIGLSAFAGRELSPFRFVVQTPGEAWRLPSKDLHRWLDETPRLQSLTVRYNDFLLSVAGQTAACNELHSITERCARWMLRVQDRLPPGESFSLTQEALAQMLGVRRASVSQAASVLQSSGLISYAYGRITVLDLDGLEAASCECTADIRRRYDMLFASLMG